MDSCCKHGTLGGLADRCRRGEVGEREVREDDRGGDRRALPERAVRTQAAVEAALAGDQDLRLPERGEDLAVVQFIAQLAVERLAAAILPGRGRFDEQAGDPEVAKPFSPPSPRTEVAVRRPLARCA